MRTLILLAMAAVSQAALITTETAHVSGRGSWGGDNYESFMSYYFSWTDGVNSILAAGSIYLPGPLRDAPDCVVIGSGYTDSWVAVNGMYSTRFSYNLCGGGMLTLYKDGQQYGAPVESYMRITSFSKDWYGPFFNGGGTFMIVPVPEPGTWAAGVGLIGLCILRLLIKHD